jgi:aldehyde:ferredoxin oxidoreductase
MLSLRKILPGWSNITRVIFGGKKVDYYGYVGQILHVDLTSGDISKQPLDTELARKFLGGWGINYRLEYDLLKPGTDPLSPDNPIIIGVGPLIGTLVPGSGKVAATMKLPIVARKQEKKYIVATGVGGSHRFGAMIKNAGYDHVVITGRAKKPSYLKIIDDDVEICDARDLWGRDVYETTDELANRHRGQTGKAGVWAIGRAGENLVTSALGFIDRVATMGRWGGGAVLGSKNLKAVVSLGTKGVKVKDPKRFMAAVDKKRKEIMSYPLYRSGVPAERHLPEGIPYPSNLYDLTKYAEPACMGCIDSCRASFRIREGRFTGDTMHSQPLAMTFSFRIMETH